MGMAFALKRVNLMLEESLIQRLAQRAQREHKSASELARILLFRGLEQGADSQATLKHIRALRKKNQSPLDSATIVRKARDHQ